MYSGAQASRPRLALLGRSLRARIDSAIAVGVFLTLALTFGEVSRAAQTAQVYAPAYYTGTQDRPPQLVIFPPGRPEVVVPLPVPSLLRATAFASDGRTLFATVDVVASPRTAERPARLGAPRLLRIDLAPVRVTTVADLKGIDWVAGMLVSPDLAHVFLKVAGWKGSPQCDLFEISASGGELKMLVPRYGCQTTGLSPDGRKRIVEKGGGLEVTDLETGAAALIGNGFAQGTWSSDGKWIAAVEVDPRGGSRPSADVVISADDFSIRRRIQPHGGLGTWSPDSRYMLSSEWSPRCPGHNVLDPGPTPISFFSVDIETGTRSLVKDSYCKVDAYFKPGWVSLDVIEQYRASGARLP